MLTDELKRLAELDRNLKEILLGSKVANFVQELKGMLRLAADQPGRAAKLRCTYMLERMIELAQDLVDDGAESDGLLFATKFSELMLWLDRAAVYSGKLLNPATAGKYMEAFDQIQKEIEIYNPKDPVMVEEREKMARNVQSRFEDQLSELRRRAENPGKEPRRSGGNIIVPGGL